MNITSRLKFSKSATCSNFRNRPKMHLFAACSNPWPELADALVGSVLDDDDDDDDDLP